MCVVFFASARLIITTKPYCGEGGGVCQRAVLVSYQQGSYGTGEAIALARWETHLLGVLNPTQLCPRCGAVTHQQCWSGGTQKGTVSPNLVAAAWLWSGPQGCCAGSRCPWPH